MIIRKCAECGEKMYFRLRDHIKKFCCKDCQTMYYEKLWQKDGGPEMPPLDVSRISDEGYIALVKAIVNRASEDVTKYKPDTQIHKDAARFFKSEYFNNLTGLDGESILRDLMKNWGKKKSEIRNEGNLAKTHTRRVRCLESGAVYDSVKETAIVFGCSPTNIFQVCTGQQKTARGLHFEYADEGDE